MAETDKTQQMSENMAANKSKSDFIEKIVFAAIPILFSCIVYLMTSLGSATNEITILKSRIAVVVTQDNRAIPPQGTTIDMAQIREQLSHRIDVVERDAAVARGNMTLDREKSMASLAASSAAMSTEAAIARAAIRAEAASARAELTQRVAILENELKHIRDQVNAR
jgi:hypothetical protein